MTHYERLVRNMTRVDPLFVARAAMELAAMAPDENTRLSLIPEVADKADKAKRAVQRTPGQQLRTGLFLANLPALFKIHIEREHPRPEVLDRAAKAGSLLLAETLSKPIHDNEIGHTYGAAADAITLSMLQRHSAQNYRDWTPVPALLSQDYAERSPDQSWKLSIFVDSYIDDPYFRIRQRFGRDDGGSRQGIASLNLAHDLRLPGEMGLKPQGISSELQTALSESPDLVASQNVLQRTLRAIDVICRNPAW
jgi:hypothetical protein